MFIPNAISQEQYTLKTSEEQMLYIFLFCTNALFTGPIYRPISRVKVCDQPEVTLCHIFLLS